MAYNSIREQIAEWEDKGFYALYLLAMEFPNLFVVCLLLYDYDS